MNQFPAERLAMVAEALPPAQAKPRPARALGAAAAIVARMSRPWARDCPGNRRVEVQVGVTAGGDAQTARLLSRTQQASASPPRFGPYGRGHFHPLPIANRMVERPRIRPSTRFTVAQDRIFRLRAIHSLISCVRMSECLSLAGGALHHFMGRSPFTCLNPCPLATATLRRDANHGVERRAAGFEASSDVVLRAKRAVFGHAC